MIKMDNFQYFSIKSYVVDIFGYMLLWRIYDNYGKTLVFCENFMSTETFT